MREDNDAVANALKPIAEMSVGVLVSEEDVKNKVVLPILKALGYDDGDFNYERRTGRRTRYRNVWGYHRQDRI